MEREKLAVLRCGSQLAVCALWLVACTPQAGDDYLGESLLSMHGNATISALTGGGSVVPALCFFWR